MWTGGLPTKAGYLTYLGFLTSMSEQALRLLLFYSPFSHRLHCPTQTCFLKRINYHDVVAQPERLILVRWMSLEPNEKRVVNHMCLDWVTMGPATVTLVKLLISAYS